jgi:putative addiction module component (TIGR02574 family)
MTGPSIFDLSPAEKLQLVEDLWDEFASTPEAIPVHDWQKQELARRKANLLKNPASGLSWEDVKQRARAGAFACQPIFSQPLTVAALPPIPSRDRSSPV